MARVRLRYGPTTEDIAVPGDALRLVPPEHRAPARCDVPAWARAAVAALGPPPRRPVLLVPDRTRDADAERLVPALLDALAEAGAPIEKPPCVFASGTHAPMSDEEMRAVLGSAVSRVIPTRHDADAPLALVGHGPDGAPVRLHPAVAEADAVLVVSAMCFHYLAGFGGGRKMLLPGVTDRETATRVHATCLRRDPPGRHPGARPGVLDDNPLHEAILARLSGVPPAAGICVVKEGGRVIDGEGGPLVEHHRALALRYAAARTVVVDAPLDGVLLSSRGAPYDGDLVQAHKALVAIAPVLRPGARVSWLARAERGFGHAEMGAWLNDGDAGAQLERLLSRFHIGRQTAWSLRSLIGRFEVGLMSELDDEVVRAFGATPLRSLEEARAFAQGGGPRFAVAPEGAALRYALEGALPDGSPRAARPSDARSRG